MWGRSFLATCPSTPTVGRTFDRGIPRLYSAQGELAATDVGLDPWLPGATTEKAERRSVTAATSFQVQGSGARMQDLQAHLDLSSVAVRGGSVELKLAQPATASLVGGNLDVGPVLLDLAQGGRLSVRAAGAMDPLDLKLAADGALDLRRLGELMGVQKAGGSVELTADAELQGPTEDGEPFRFGGDGAHASVKLGNALLGPWIEWLGVLPGVRGPAGLLTADATVHALSLRPQDVRAEIGIQRVELKLDTLQASGVGPLAIRFDGHEARLAAWQLGLGGKDRLALQGSVWPLERRVDLSASASVDLAKLSPLAGRPLEGRLDATLQAQGAIDAPRVSGQVQATGLSAAGASIGSLNVELGPPAPSGLAISGFGVPTGTIDATQVEARDFVAGRVGIRLEADGAGGLTGHVSVGGLRRKDKPLGDLDGRVDLDARVARVQLAGLQGQLRLDASWPFESDETGTARVELKALDLGPVLELAGLPLEAPPKGTLSATGQFHFPAGDPARAEGTLDLTQLALGLDRLDLVLQSPARLALAAGSVDVAPLTLVARSGAPDAEPATLTLRGKASADRLDLHVQGAWPLAGLRPFVPGFESMDGVAQIALAIAGSPAAPDVQGTVQLAGGTVVYARPRVELKDVQARLDAKGHTIELSSVKATLGGGLVSARGKLDLGKGGAMTADLGIRALGATMDLAEFDIAMTVDADLTYRGPVASGQLQGQVRLTQARYTPRLSPLDLLERLTTRVRVVGPLAIDPGLLADGGNGPVLGPEPQMNLSISAGAGTIEVDSANVKATAQAELQVVGKPSVPGVLGVVQVTDGTLDVYATKFEGLQGSIDFERDPYALNPKLDLKATTTKSSEDITLAIGGHALSPALELTSSSGRPQMDVIRTLVTGSGGSGSTSITDQLGSLAEQQAASVASQRLSSAIGLDLQLVPPPVGQAQLLFSLGKQLSEKLFVKYYKVATPEFSDIYEVRFDATGSLSLEARRTESQSNTLRIRFRKRFD